MKPTLSIGDFLIIALIIGVLLSIGFAVVSYKSETVTDKDGNETTRMKPSVGSGSKKTSASKDAE